MATRGRPPGQPKTGGRVKSSLDRQQRQLVSAELAHSILATFEMLGGTAAMVEWAADNPTVFYTQILSRLMPAPQRDDGGDIQFNQQVNINNMSDSEAARRVAFALAKAVYESPAIEVEATPEDTYLAATRWRPPDDMPDMPEPVEYPDPDRERWASEIHLTPQERADNSLVRETKECTLANYRGSPGEQGDGQYTPVVNRKPSAAELCRRLSRRGKDLM